MQPQPDPSFTTQDLLERGDNRSGGRLERTS